jgi:hypothetical protein
MRGNKRERIIRVMLSEGSQLSKNEISKRAGCTRQWVIQFLRELTKKRYLNDTDIKDKKGLIKYWLTIHKKPKKFKEYMVKNPLSLLKKTRLEYALTTYQAENIMQHHLFPSRIDLYVKEDDMQKWHPIMTKNGLYGKGNVRIIVEDEHVMHNKRKLNNLFVVSLPQLIIDLITEGGPCEEAAEMLMKRL